MDVRKAVDEYTYACFGKTAKTQKWYRGKLAQFVAWCEEQGLELDDLRADEIRKYIAHLRDTPRPDGKPRSTYTVRGYSQVVKGFLHWCQKEELFEERTYQRIRDTVENPKVDIKGIETFTDEQVQRFFLACAHNKSIRLQSRDKAILAILFDTGIRLQALYGLKLDDVFLTTHDSFIRVMGKGRKQREVGLSQQARVHLQRYLNRGRPKTVEPYVFIGYRNRPMAESAVEAVLRRLGKLAGITGCAVLPTPAATPSPATT
jgi:site-specific recombinase XerD